VGNIDSVLNSLYCLSQAAAITIKSLRVYPHLVENPSIPHLYVIMVELHANSLEAYKGIKPEPLREDLCSHLSAILSKVDSIQETFDTLVTTSSLPQSHILVKKLKLQISSILLTLANLAEILDKLIILDERNLVVL
jgi:hypothetical protein